MTMSNIKSLAGLVRTKQAELLSQWREEVRLLPGAQDLDRPTLDDHVPDLILELAAALEARLDETIAENVLDGTAPAHGLARLRDGFDITEVVAEYNILRGCVHDLAQRNDLSLQGEAFHIMNRVLDEAIAVAVQSYATQRALEVQARREEHLTFVAHDLRTPLSAISLATNVLEKVLTGKASEQEAERMLQSLRRNVQRLDAIVLRVIQEQDNLRTDAMVKVELREFDLWPLVQALIVDLQPLAKASGTTIQNRVPLDLVVHADAILLAQVFQNLIANAIEYSPRGVVGVEASIDAMGTVECSVRDDGAGIPPELIDKVFDKLETDPDKKTGLGLGLAIVKQFVEAHGGGVAVESRAGLGTTFRFTLPVPGKQQPGLDC